MKRASAEETEKQTSRTKRSARRKSRQPNPMKFRRRDAAQLEPASRAIDGIEVGSHPKANPSNQLKLLGVSTDLVAGTGFELLHARLPSDPDATHRANPKGSFRPAPRPVPRTKLQQKLSIRKYVSRIVRISPSAPDVQPRLNFPAWSSPRHAETRRVEIDGFPYSRGGLGGFPRLGHA